MGQKGITVSLVQGFIMAYTNRNFKTKKALKEAVANGEEVKVHEPGLGEVPENGSISLEGPHYPKPHTWYASAILENGIVVKVT
jgi:hypothetical protein